MIMLVAGCLWLGWWQIGRAVGGNALSFGYAVEWPVFALFALFVWVREIRADIHKRRGSPPPARARDTADADLLISVPEPGRPPAGPGDDEADPGLRAYNDYLAWLNANPQARPSDYRVGR
jgi:hypothetical protein